MKKILLMLTAAAFVLSACSGKLEKRVDDLEHRVSTLEEFVTNLNANVKGISTLVAGLQQNVYVTDVRKHYTATGAEDGWELTLNQGSEPIIIYHGLEGDKGDKGDPGLIPTIDYDSETGKWYWCWEGEDGWIRDRDNNRIEATKNIEFDYDEQTGELFVTIDGMSPAVNLGVVKGEKGDSWFDGVEVDEEAGTVTIDVKGTDTDLVLPLYQFIFKVTAPAEIPAIAGSEVNLTYTVSSSAAANTIVRAYPSKGIEAAVVKGNDNAGTVVVTLGTVSGYVDVYAINNETGEIKAQTVNFEAGEYIHTTLAETKLYVSPLADGTVELPFSTAAEYTIEIENGSWLSQSIADTKALVQHKTLTLTATESNTSENDRTATVKFKVADKVVAEFDIVQKNYYTELVDLSLKETWNHSMKTDGADGGTISIELSDDFSKGVYKMVNIFNINTLYFGSGSGRYYADVEGNDLIVHTAGIATNYNDNTAPGHQSLSFKNTTEDMTFQLNADKTGFSLTIPDGQKVKIGTVDCTAYSAEKKVAATVDPIVESVLGTYSDTFSGTWPAPGTTTIEVSDDPEKGNVMIQFCSNTTIFYGTVSATTENGASAKIEINESNNIGTFGPVIGTIYYMSMGGTTQLFSAGQITLGGMSVYYSANKQ